jgi:low affinity Fe/Cu permease
VATPHDPTDRSTPLTRAIGTATEALGSFTAIVLSFVVVGAWFAGVLVVPGKFGNDSYQLVINTGTTIITFWMVFIIQNTQNRDGRAMQAKLDAQSAVLRVIADRLGAGDEGEVLLSLIGVEDAPERVIKADQAEVRRVAQSTD